MRRLSGVFGLFLFLAPVGLRLTIPRVRMTDDEARRILISESTGMFDPAAVRVLLATGGGVNAHAAATLAFGLGQRRTRALNWPDCSVQHPLRVHANELL